MPWLYLKGISIGDFQEALTVLLGKDAPGLSASTINRLKANRNAGHGAICRTAKTRGCVSRDGILAMVFMLVKSAERHRRKLNGIPRLAQVTEGVIFKDGVQEDIEKIAV